MGARVRCPIYLHEAERKWVLRTDPSVRFWEGETHELGGGLTLIRCGGHYEGGQVLHWAERRALLSGDIVQVIPDRRYVSFMYSYPNLIPLPPSKVQGDRASARAVRVRLDLRRLVGPLRSSATAQPSSAAPPTATSGRSPEPGLAS